MADAALLEPFNIVFGYDVLMNVDASAFHGCDSGVAVAEVNEMWRY
jgi:hypothetical protein